MKIRTAIIPEMTITRFARMQDVVDYSPPYQREGGIWPVETRAALIDSIINGFDLPKLYFERETSRRRTIDGLSYQYAVVDGKQRLEAIMSFLSDELRLPEDFKLFEDEDVHAAGMTLGDLLKSYPQLAQRFFDFELPIVSIVTDSGDLIEELFQRLNASSSLTAAERRNAISGATRDAANRLSEHDFLAQRSPIRNARFKYRELAAKFLAVEHQFDTRGRISDTKAATLYSLFSATHGVPQAISDAEMNRYELTATATLDRMSEIFADNDELLSSIGTVVVYYLVFRNGIQKLNVDRKRFKEFEVLRQQASKMSEFDPEYARPANARLREYNALVQSTNDGKALSRRAEILSSFLTNINRDDPLLTLDRLEEGIEIPEDPVKED